jgi:hypothetical protein
LTVYDLLFSCNIKSPNGSRIETKGNFVYSQDGVMAQRVNFLAPGNSATRSCDVGAQIPDIGYPATFDFTVDFVWPFIRKPSSVTKHFTTRRGAPGNIMIVPD